jgi:hypothetical protein
MDEAFVIVSVISGIFGIIGLLILDRNWFRRERFKFEIDTKKKEYDLNFKKLKHELGLDMKSPPYRTPASSPLENLSPLLSLAKNLNPDQLGALADILGGQEAEGGGEDSSGISSLVDFATKNPDLVKGFMDGISKGKGQDESGLL